MPDSVGPRGAGFLFSFGGCALCAYDANSNSVQVIIKASVQISAKVSKNFLLNLGMKYRLRYFICAASRELPRASRFPPRKRRGLGAGASLALFRRKGVAARPGVAWGGRAEQGCGSCSAVVQCDFLCGGCRCNGAKQPSALQPLLKWLG